MNATAAPSAAPTYAVTAWVDRQHIYIEFPSIHGPMVLQYPRSEQGWRDSLVALADRHLREGVDQDFHYQPSPLPDRHGATLAQRNAVDELLRKKGIT
jgi:hypothetical protein